MHPIDVGLGRSIIVAYFLRVKSGLSIASLKRYKTAFYKCFKLAMDKTNKKLSYCCETVRRESMPRIAEMDVEMTT